jgi:hypothetical protein
MVVIVLIFCQNSVFAILLKGTLPMILANQFQFCHSVRRARFVLSPLVEKNLTTVSKIVFSYEIFLSLQFV